MRKFSFEYLFDTNESSTFMWNKPVTLSIEEETLEKAISKFLQSTEELANHVSTDAYNDTVTFTNSIDGERISFLTTMERLKPSDAFRKISFRETGHGTIRAFLYFDEEQDETLMRVRSCKEYKMLQLLSIFGQYDRFEQGMFSWDLHITLKDFLIHLFEGKEKFEFHWGNS